MASECVCVGVYSRFECEWQVSVCMSVCECVCECVCEWVSVCECVCECECVYITGGKGVKPIYIRR